MTHEVAFADVPELYASRTTPCVVHDGRPFSWAELEARSSAWSGWLMARGVQADDLVAFQLENGFEFVALAFGIYKAGATPAPLSPKLPRAEIDEILALMKPAVFVDATPVTFDGEGRRRADVAVSWKACTSGGSTGRPKVIVDHRAARFDIDQSFIGLPRDQAIAIPGPLYHNAPFSALVVGLARGNTLVTASKFDPLVFLKAVEAQRVSWALLVPTMMHRIWRLREEGGAAADVSSLTCVAHTAAPMAPWLKHAWIDWLGPDAIWEAYGATEGLARTWIGGRDWLKKPGSVGQAGGGSQFIVLGPDGARLGPGEIGEIYAMPAGGPGSTYHYIGADRRATADGWETVGDIGWLDEDGYLFLADRRTDLIITGGMNVWPAEVEAALLQHPDIASCAVVGLPNDDLGHTVHAVIESARSDLTPESLKTYLADRLARYKHPRSVEIVQRPVRDDAGKVRRGDLVRRATT